MIHHPIWPDQVATEQAKANIMTAFRPDTSFPYLKIAREYDRPYGDVIRFVEEIDTDRLVNRWGHLAPWQIGACAAWKSEYERRRTA